MCFCIIQPTGCNIINKLSSVQLSNNSSKELNFRAHGMPLRTNSVANTVTAIVKADHLEAKSYNDVWEFSEQLLDSGHTCPSNIQRTGIIDMETSIALSTLLTVNLISIYKLLSQHTTTYESYTIITTIVLSPPLLLQSLLSCGCSIGHIFYASCPSVCLSVRLSHTGS